MKLFKLLVGLLIASLTLSAQSSGNEQFFPVLSYRSGPYAPSGIPLSNGYIDYLKLINVRDGGINGVKLKWEECDTGFATDRGVECYERLKGKSQGAIYQPYSTGITFALTEKVPSDKNVLFTNGYGRSESSDGQVFKWNFPLQGTYWSGADVIIQHLLKKENGNLKDKKIALLYHDSPYGKEPILLLQERSKMHGFNLQLLPIVPPGVEQKSVWLSVRQSKPDYVLLWGWGVMNSTAIKEAVATAYPREKMFGVWWSATDTDVRDIGEAARGYTGLILTGPGGRVLDDIKKYLASNNQLTGNPDEIGTVLYNRGIVAAALSVEAIRRAQTRYGRGKVMNGEQIRWGMENLALDKKALNNLGLASIMQPISTSCADHAGSNSVRLHTWDGSKWNYITDWIEADMSIIKPLIKQQADKYAADKKLTRRTPADCQS